MKPKTTPEKNPAVPPGDQVKKLINNDSNPKLAGAKEALKQKLLHAVMSQAMEELGKPDDIATEVMKRFGPDHELIMAASGVIKEQLIHEIAASSEASLRDSQASAEQARDELGETPDVVIGASSILRDLVLQEIANRSMDMFSDAGVVACQARERIEADNENLTRCINTLKDLLVDEIARRTTESINDSKEIAEEARSRVDHETEAIREAVVTLRQRLIENVAKRSIEAIANPAETASSAFEYIGAEHASVDAAMAALRDLLLDTVAAGALGTMEDAARSAEQAYPRVEADCTILTEAIGELKESLIDDIAIRSLESLSDTQSVAQHAREKVDEKNEGILSAVDELRDRLYDEIAGSATTELDDTLKTVEQAHQRVAADNESFMNAVAGLKDRLLSEVADHAIAALSDENDIARQAREHVADDHDALIGASSVLGEILVEDIAARTTNGMKDAGEVAKRARTQVDDSDPMISTASDELRALLIKDIARHTTAALRDAEEAANEAMSHVENEEGVIVEARRVLKERMLQRMLNEAIREINEAVGEDKGEQDDFFREAVFAASKTVNKESNTESADEEEVIASAEEVPSEEVEIVDEVPNSCSEEYDIETKHEEPVAEIDAPANEDADKVPAKMGRASDDDSLLEPECSGEELQEDTSDESANELDTAEDTPEEDDSEELEEAYIEIVNSDQSESEEVIAFTNESIVEPSDQSTIDDGWTKLSDIDAHDGPEANGACDDESSSDEMKVGDDISAEMCKQDIEGLARPDVVADSDPNAESEPVQQPEEMTGADTEFDPSSAMPGESPAGSQDEVGLDEVAGDSEDEKPWRTNSIWEGDEPVGGDGVVEQPEPVLAEGGIAYYVYGVMDAEAANSIDQLPEEGIDSDHAVFLVPCNELQAIVSKVPLDQYGKEAVDAQMKDTAWLKKKVRAHARIMESFRNGGTLIPLRFGTTCASESEMHEMLDERYDQLRSAIERLQHRQEWGLRIYRDDRVLRDRLEENDQRVENSLGIISKGIAHFVRDEMQKMDTISASDLITIISEHCLQRSHEALLEHSDGGIFKPLLGEMTQESEELIANIAYLVPEGEDESFQSIVEEVAGECLGLGFRFELSGPWPPYHFVEIERGEDGSQTLSI